jgi:hypothetical protein
VDDQKMVHDLYSALFDGIMDAIEFGFNQYRQTAGLVDVQIQAAMAKGARERDGTRTAVVPVIRRVSGARGTADAQHAGSFHGASARRDGHLGAKPEGGDVLGATRQYGLSHGVFRQPRDGFATAAGHVESFANGCDGL